MKTSESIAFTWGSTLTERAMAFPCDRSLSAQCHVSCYEVQSRRQQKTGCYFSSKTSDELSLPGYTRDVKYLPYLIT